MKTPDDYKRADVREVFSRRLGSNIITLNPLSIKIEESLEEENTLVDLAFDKVEDGVKTSYNFEKVPGSGFVDAIYKMCYELFVKQYPSLENLSLVDVLVRPIFSMSKSEAKTDAKTDVSFRIKTKQHGISEFTTRSRSIVYSCLSSMLEAFQFYMNCDKSFRLLQRVLQDAQVRRRGDIKQACMLDLSALTGVNTYA